MSKRNETNTGIGGCGGRRDRLPPWNLAGDLHHCGAWRPLQSIGWHRLELLADPRAPVRSSLAVLTRLVTDRARLSTLTIHQQSLALPKKPSCFR